MLHTTTTAITAAAVAWGGVLTATSLSPVCILPPTLYSLMFVWTLRFALAAPL